MILPLYRGLTSLMGPLIGIYLGQRLVRGKEEENRLSERKGRSALPRPAGRLVWMHAASIGESLSLLPVIERIAVRPGLKVLVTTGTVTSARLMADRLPAGAIHQYIPLDRLAWVRAFLDHWRPDLALWAESEFWPNLLIETADRAIPLILLNGRISESSFARWRRHPRLARRLLSCFRLCLAQTEEDAQRLELLGAGAVRVRGNLKFAAPPLPADPSVLAGLEAEIGARPRWLAASTHDGEEEMAGRIHRRLSAFHPDLLTVIVPRHPERGEMIAETLNRQGITVARRSLGEAPGPEAGVLLADTLGELGLFMRLAPQVFMGKSLSGQGGQNPLEPARLGAAVLFGPNMDNFTEIAENMLSCKAAIRVTSEDELAGALEAGLADPARLGEQGARAKTFAAAQDGVLDAILAELDPWLPEDEVAGS